METKRCSHCKETLPLSMFVRNRAQKDGYANQCKTCLKESQQRSAAKHHRRWHAKHRYGVSREEYEQLLKRTCCDVCGATSPGSGAGRFFDIDHDHRTGKVRGVLCRRCNMALHEDVTPAVLRALAEYLERYEE